MGVSVQSNFQLTKCSSLYLVSVLQFLNPFGFIALKASNLALNRHALLIFLVNFADEFSALLLSLHLLLHVASLKSLLFLVANHLLHRFVFELLSVLLNLDHLFMLVALTLDVLRVDDVLRMLLHLLLSNGFLLFVAHNLILVG